MNERIRKLAEQAGLEFDDDESLEFGKQIYYVTKEDMEKFAELIVKECAQYMYEHYPHSLYEVNYMRKHMGDADWYKPIKQHFGVEG